MSYSVHYHATLGGQVQGPKTEESMDSIICEFLLKSYEGGAGADGNDLNDPKEAGGTDGETPHQPDHIEQSLTF